MAESSSPILFAPLARYARTISVSWLPAVAQWLKREWPVSELADSRKLAKQILLPKKEIRLLTNLRFLNPPALRVSQARLMTQGTLMVTSSALLVRYLRLLYISGQRVTTSRFTEPEKIFSVLKMEYVC